MIYYGPGDEIVSVHTSSNGNLKKGQIFTCLDMGDSMHFNFKHVYFSVCTRCKVDFHKLIIVEVMPGVYGCSCWFRKKLDFKKLCNVDERMPVSA